jgi:hypothetical protein
MPLARSCMTCFCLRVARRASVGNGAANGWRGFAACRTRRPFIRGSGGAAVPPAGVWGRRPPFLSPSRSGSTHRAELLAPASVYRIARRASVGNGAANGWRGFAACCARRLSSGGLGEPLFPQPGFGAGSPIAQPSLRRGMTIFQVFSQLRKPPGPSPVAAKMWVGTPSSIRSCGRSTQPCAVVEPSSHRIRRE